MGPGAPFGKLGFESRQFVLRHGVGVGGVGKAAGSYLGRVRLERLEGYRAEIGVALDEPGHVPGRKSEQIMPDQHLSVTGRAGPDANCGDLQRL